MEDQRGIVFLQCDVVATQSCHMCAHRQTQKAERSLAVLRLCYEGKKCKKGGQNNFFHH